MFLFYVLYRGQNKTYEIDNEADGYDIRISIEREVNETISEIMLISQGYPAKFRNDDGIACFEIDKNAQGKISYTYRVIMTNGKEYDSTVTFIIKERENG